MEACYKKLIKSIGENVNRPGLKETPQRATKAFEYLTGGYNQDVRKVINNALFPSDNDEMIIVKDIELYSLCEHHLLPFFGKCHVGYLPDGKIIGLSKVARVVDIFPAACRCRRTSPGRSPRRSWSRSVPKASVWSSKRGICA